MSVLTSAPDGIITTSITPWARPSATLTFGLVSGLCVCNALAVGPGDFGTGNQAGFIGGGQFGWNYQTGALVWGFEADFQGADTTAPGLYQHG